MTINLAVVPVAGHGTRLLPATKSQPKEMLPVGRRPVVQYVVEELNRSGIEHIVFVTGPGKAAIENHLDVNRELIQSLREKGREELLEELEFAPAYYSYTRQAEQLGLGHAVLCARPSVGNQPFAVALGDTIIGMHAKSDITLRMARLFEERRAAAVIAFDEVPHEEVDQYGIAKAKGGGDVFEVEDLVEKPPREEAPSNLAIAARYVFAPGIFDALGRTKPGRGREIQLTDAIRLVLKEGGKVYGVRLGPGEPRFDIGNFDSYFRAFVEFALADEKYGASLRAHLEKLLGR